MARRYDFGDAFREEQRRIHRAAERQRKQPRERKSRVRRFIEGTGVAIQFASNVYGGQVDPAQVSQTTFDNFSDMREENLSQQRTDAIEQATYASGHTQTSRSRGYDDIRAS